MYLPVNTYRIQLHHQFTLRDLEDILPYLHDLGIRAIYASPLSSAVPGSQHGYDVTDPLRLNPDIGTEEQWKRLSDILKRYGMGWIQDIVPNHMAYDTRNPWLQDVLQRGRYSRYYSWFDIDAAEGPVSVTGHIEESAEGPGSVTGHAEESAEPPTSGTGGRLMAPFLGNTLAECLQKGELSLQFTPQGFVIRYFDADYPVGIPAYRRIVTIAGDCPPDILSSVHHLEEALPAAPVLWKQAFEGWLQSMHSDATALGFMTARASLVSRQIPLLESLVQDQPYILTHYRFAATHINYRRFFTINGLICLHMENREVFDAWHRGIRDWQARGWIDGLRIDHIDGLADPKKYLQELNRLFGGNIYTVTEKILGFNEALPVDWPTQGTTGYDFLGDTNQLLTDAAGSRELLDFYQESIVNHPAYEELVGQQKFAFLARNMGGEWENLFQQLSQLLHPRALSAAGDRLKQALGMWMACFPAYRAYPDAQGLSPADRAMLDTAFRLAKQRNPGLQPEFHLLADALTHEQNSPLLRRLMQFTGPLAAKGIEDTTFYIYNPYISHCEVGDTPAMAGISTTEFHRRMQIRQSTRPHSLNATSTHDTKRGEDARIRLNYLSAVPREWIHAVAVWRQCNKALVGETTGRRAPTANDEYLIYQALLGAWPEDGVLTDAFRKRFAGYLTKALREAATETHHDEPDEEYESHCQDFVSAILQPDSLFLETFAPFARHIVRQSAPYCLAQLLLKTTAPGVPDIYQGAELWETSMVDPDNRRPVDYDLRRSLLEGIKAAEAKSPEAVLNYVSEYAEKGAAKLYTLYRSLAVCNGLPRLFGNGTYVPLQSDGPLLAYLRKLDDEQVLVAVPLIRHEAEPTDPNSTLPSIEAGSKLHSTAPDSIKLPATETLSITLPPTAPQVWEDVFTGETLRVNNGTLSWPRGFHRFPVVLAIAR